MILYKYLVGKIVIIMILVIILSIVNLFYVFLKLVF